MKKTILLLMAFALIQVSCSNDDDNVSSTENLRLDLNGLENLGSDYVYEGWLMVDGTPISSGRFTVSDEGTLSQTSFPIDASDLEAATAFILTIEPATGDDPAASDVHILAGDFNGNSGSATVGHNAALGNSFADAAGAYILATPTDGGGMDNEESGVWFLDNSSGTPSTGLTLPTLPAGWTYEGWAVIDGTPVSTGTFSAVDMADNNASTSPYKGTVSDGPGFPGEDFLENAPSGLSFPTDLRGGNVVISVEPVPDNSPGPFTLKPLADMVPTDAAVHTVVGMDLNLGSFPSGTFSR